MSDDLIRAIKLWRDADTEARSAEHLLTQAYSNVLAKKESTVAIELIDQVARTRARSNEFLMEALDLMKVERVEAIARKNKAEGR
jgi:hypothetical protein